MMDRRIAMLPLLALAGTSMSGCVAAAIPALAGSAIFGTQIDGKDGKQAEPAPSRPAPVIAVAPTIRTAPGAPASSYPDPSSPLPTEQNNFARFVRYRQASARCVEGDADLASAMLSDPIALDGKRRRCTTGEQLVALIDLDPAGDERFKYLRNPEAGAGLEPVIGDGWFLISPLFAEAESAGQ